MKLFDLHCDTIGACAEQNKPLFSNDLHIALDRTAALDEYVQVFAAWIPDELRGENAVRYFLKLRDRFNLELQRNKGVLSRYGDPEKTRVKALFSVEGGAALGGKAENFSLLKEAGVRLLTLTWNGENELASGAYAGGGLKVFGRKIIDEADKAGIVIDVSHLNREGFFDVARIANKPFIASHSNADIVDTDEGHHRNLTNEQIAVIRDSGGLIGLNYYTAFLEDASCHGIDALCRQIDHFLSLGCGNVIALGSDFDGCEVPKELSGIEKMPGIFEELLRRGYRRDVLDALFFKNAARFFETK